LFNIKDTAAILVTTLALAACGGGGGSSTSGSTTPTNGSTGTTTPTAPVSTIVTSVPTATYAANSTEATLYAQLNALRLAAGSGLLAQNSALDTSSKAHANYVSLNGLLDPSFHIETAGQPGFTGASPSARATAAGYSAGADEVGYTAFVAGGNINSVNFWADSVYHISVVLGNLHDVGFGCEDAPLPNNTTGQPITQSVCVSDFGNQAGIAGQIPLPYTVLAYPYSGQTGVPTGFSNQEENPVPAPDLNGVGQPVLVNLNDTVASVSQFTLTTVGGTAVPARILVASSSVTGTGLTVDANMSSEGMSTYAVLLPTSALTANTTYTVTFTGMGTANTAKTYTLSWSFTTGDF